MYADHLIMETDNTGKIINTPTLPANKHIEGIFLVLEDIQAQIGRKPPPDLAGKVKIVDDIFDSSPLSDWDLSL